MKKMRILSKAWNKAFRKGENPAQLVDDMGPLRGYAEIIPYDIRTGVRGQSLGKCNTLVNQSKSNLIRLISQGQSPHIGQIAPADLKISRMRFSNNLSSGTPSKLLYYSLTEPSVRACTPVTGTPGTRYAGGSVNDTISGEAVASVAYEIQNIAGNYVVGSTSNIKIFPIRNATTGGGLLQDNPPSHNTLKVELFNGLTLLETIYFYDPTTLTDVHSYTRGAINPHIVVTEATVASNEVMAPAARTDTYNAVPNCANLITAGDSSKTFLFYDYNDNTWKFQLEEVAGYGSRYTRIVISYDRGTYNVINSVVPRDGFNVGQGTTLSTRYSNMTAGDYYPVLSDVEYRDGDVDFVDDYSATFSVNMAGQYGNGVTTLATQYVKYREAFLFNGRDDMFSALFLDAAYNFDKNPLTAFFISWTILAPIG